VPAKSFIPQTTYTSSLSNNFSDNAKNAHPLLLQF